jgi:capsular polysaccharide transport system permease protein
VTVQAEGRTSRRFLPARELTFLAGLRNQTRVIKAVTIREISERYGTEGLGYFWVFGEPMLLCFGVMILWTILKNNHGGSVGFGLFALTGYSHVQLFRHCVFNSSQAISRSVWLAYHSSVHPLDILIAKTLMGSLGIFGAFVIGYLILYVFGGVELPRDPLLVVAAWGLDTLFCFSFSLVIAGISDISHLAEKLLHPLMYLTIPLMGSFTFTDWLPVAARKVLVWSPLVNAVEMLRAGVYPLDIRTYWDPGYILFSSLVCLTIGLPLVSYARKPIVVR